MHEIIFLGWGKGGGGERIPESWDLESTDKDLESSTEYLELGIHGVESRIQDCIGSLA